MKCHRFKSLFEGIHQLGLKKGLSIKLYYGLSKNSYLMEYEYRSIIKALEPYIEYENKIAELKEKYKNDEFKLKKEIESFDKENEKLIKDTEKFMNEEIDFEPYLIDYKEFPEDLFINKLDMDFWIPILKD